MPQPKKGWKNRYLGNFLCIFIYQRFSLSSVATMSHCVKHFQKATGSSLEEALEAATLHPALCLDIEDRKGTLEYGTDADFIMLDDKVNIHATFIGGKNVYASPALHERGVVLCNNETSWYNSLFWFFLSIASFIKGFKLGWHTEVGWQLIIEINRYCQYPSYDDISRKFTNTNTVVSALKKRASKTKFVKVA